MSVEVKNLTKIYGQQKAVDNISFVANKGEILGFLGPNGAGKSTTMKIATGYLSANSGTVIINNHDVSEESLATRQIVGYLPEHNPLYLDMYVHEFLAFSCKSYQYPKSKSINRINEVVELCGLKREQNKQIGQLSKGYRQRVGLAQALLHEPEVLILDEPTTGLDPNQIIEIRALIKQVSKNRTVIFSSHIMQEVQALCDRVVVINKGKIVSDQSINDFSKGFSNETKLKVEFKEAIDISLLEAIHSVGTIVESAVGIYIITTKESEEARSEIFKIASDKKLPLLSLQEISSSLEEVFHTLTTDK